MLRAYVDQQLRAKLDALVASDPNAYLQHPVLDSARSGVSVTSESVFVARYTDTGTLAQINWIGSLRGQAPAVPATFTVSDVVNRDYGEFVLDSVNSKGVYRAVASFGLFPGHTTEVPYLVIISAQDSINLLNVFVAVIIGLGAAITLVGALVTRMAVTAAFSPLHAAERTASAIADGDFSKRITGSASNSEVGRLNRSLNSMLSQIEHALRDRAATIAQMQRFISDVSHELRTPLVSLRGYAELHRMGAFRTHEEVSQAMGRIEREAIRMAGLVEDMLSLARLDEARPLEVSPALLMPLAEDAARDLVASWPDRTVTVTEHAPVGAVVMVNEHKIHQVLMNLISNAIRFSTATTPIDLHVGADVALRQAYVDVVDHGEGIPQAVRDRVFERFGELTRPATMKQVARGWGSPSWRLSRRCTRAPSRSLRPRAVGRRSA